MKDKLLEEQLKRLESPFASPRQKSIILNGLMMRNQFSLDDKDNAEFWKRISLTKER